MTRQRVALYLLLLVVAAAAAVLSFDALKGLALICGFTPELAWLLPVTIDAGAAASSIVWLGTAAPGARSYGRTLALVLLASSVGGNALGHGLAAYGVKPHWGVVVAVSAIAPAVLGALVHLVVLAGRPQSPTSPPTGRDRATTPADDTPEDTLDEEAAELFEAAQAERAEEQAEEQAEVGGLPDRRAAVDVSRDGAVIDDLRAVAGRTGRRYSRDEVKEMYGIGSPRASRLLTLIGWMPRENQQAEQAAGAAR